MVLSYTILPELRLNLIHVAGSVSGNDLADLYRAYLTDPAWEPTFDVLWDGRRISELIIGWASVERMVGTALELKDRRGPGRTAFLAARAADFEAAEIYPRLVGLLGHRDPRRIKRSFGTSAAAAKWLGLDARDLARHGIGTHTTPTTA